MCQPISQSINQFIVTISVLHIQIAIVIQNRCVIHVKHHVEGIKCMCKLT